MNANVKLSQSELQLVCDEQFILTKNNIINKVYLLFGTLSDVFLQKTKNVFVAFYAEDGNFFGGFDNARGVSDICSDVNDCEE